MLDEWLEEKLHTRRDKGLHRALPQASGLTDFTSNDYFGLARNEALHILIKEVVSGLPVQNGATGSRLLSGNSAFADKVEYELAAIFNSAAALLFNSGYSANLAVLSSIPGKNDTIIYDELAHASIKDGARLSLAKKFAIRHNDLADLERKVSRSQGRVYVAVESIYSMDGDECPLEELTSLSAKLGFTIMLDEAHSTGVRGPRGSGIAVEKGLHDRVGIRIYTFGKAMGVCGACVCGSGTVIDYLVNHARPFIYTTAPSQHQLASIKCSFDFLAENMHLQDSLRHKTESFIQHSENLEQRGESRSAIQSFIVPGNIAVREAASRIQQKGFDVRPIVSPTVPQGKERLRICIHTFNTNEEITGLAHALNTIGT